MQRLRLAREFVLSVVLMPHSSKPGFGQPVCLSCTADTSLRRSENSSTQLLKYLCIRLPKELCDPFVCNATCAETSRVCGSGSIFGDDFTRQVHDKVIEQVLGALPVPVAQGVHRARNRYRSARVP